MTCYQHYRSGVLAVPAKSRKGWGRREVEEGKEGVQRNFNLLNWLTRGWVNARPSRLPETESRKKVGMDLRGSSTGCCMNCSMNPRRRGFCGKVDGQFLHARWWP